MDGGIAVTGASLLAFVVAVLLVLDVLSIDPPLTGLCSSCGDLVWRVQEHQRLPAYSQHITCLSCGTENGRIPPVLWRVRNTFRRLLRRRRAYGLLKITSGGNGIPWFELWNGRERLKAKVLIE